MNKNEILQAIEDYNQTINNQKASLIKTHNLIRGIMITNRKELVEAYEIKPDFSKGRNGWQILYHAINYINDELKQLTKELIWTGEK